MLSENSLILLHLVLFFLGVQCSVFYSIKIQNYFSNIADGKNYDYDNMYLCCQCGVFALYLDLSVCPKYQLSFSGLESPSLSK